MSCRLCEKDASEVQDGYCLRCEKIAADVQADLARECEGRESAVHHNETKPRKKGLRTGFQSVS